MSKQAEEIPELVVADAAAWQEWLGKHHGEASGVWLVLSKKDTVTPTSLTSNKAREGALSPSWTWFTVKVTPSSLPIPGSSAFFGWELPTPIAR